MEAGIEWTLDDLPRVPRPPSTALPKGINYAGYIGHSALRTYVMGERAFEQDGDRGRSPRDGARAARRDPRRRHRLHDLALAEPRDAGRAGRWRAALAELGRGAAAGRRDGRHERRHLRARRRGRGPRAGDPGPARVPRAAARPRRRDRAARSRSASFSRREVPDAWRKYLALLDETAAAGGRMFAQVHSRALSALLSFKTQTAVRPPAGVEGAARAAARRAEAAAARSRAAAPAGRGRGRARRSAAPLGTEARPADYDWLLVFDSRGRARTARWPRSRASAASDPGGGDDRPRAREGPGPRSSCSPSPTRTRTTRSS